MEAPREVTPHIARDGGELRRRGRLGCSGKSAFLLRRIAGCGQRTGKWDGRCRQLTEGWNVGQRSTPNISEGGHQKMSATDK